MSAGARSTHGIGASRPRAILLWFLACVPACAQAPETRDSKAEATAFLASLDAAFNAGDEKGFAAQFRPRHRAASKACLERSTRLIPLGKDRPNRTSRVKSARPWSGGHVVEAIVCLERKTVPPCRMEWVEAMALERDPAGRLRCTLAVECCEMFDVDIKGQTFECPPCNYSITAPGTDWLIRAVPLQEGQSHETVVFYSLASELEVEVSVHVGTKVLGCAEALDEALRCLGAPTGGKADARAPAPLLEAARKSCAEWKPRQCKTAQGARVDLDLSSWPDRGDLSELMRLHLLSIGRVRYLICALGSRDEMRNQAPELDALIGSFRLNDESAEPQALVQSIARGHHGAASFEGRRYVNKSARVAMEGPEGFAPEIKVGPADFLARWERAATGCELLLVGVRLWRDEWTDERARLYREEILRGIAAAQGGTASVRGEPRRELVDGRTSVTLAYAVEAPEVRGFLGMTWKGRLLVYVDGRTRGHLAEETLERFRQSFATLVFKD